MRVTGGGNVRIDTGHADYVARPSACLLVEELFPHLTRPPRDRLVRRVTAFLMTTLLAFAEFSPPTAVPEPSQN